MIFHSSVISSHSGTKLCFSCSHWNKPNCWWSPIIDC